MIHTETGLQESLSSNAVLEILVQNLNKTNMKPKH